jgi:hypothetical protein
MSKDYRMPFGKYKGETLEEIYVEDVGYLEWLREEMVCKGDEQSKALAERIVNCFKEMRNVRICK